MRCLALKLLSIVCLSCITSSVFAGEQRVLMSFDNSGHHVRHIANLESTRTLRSGIKNSRVTTLERPDIEAMISELQPGVALIVWTDDEGYLQLKTEEPDPRVSHAPAHINGAGASRLGQRAGAWLVIGPDSATSITILLPSDASLGLGFEQWEVLLGSV